MKKAIQKLVPYFDPESIIQDYNIRDGLAVKQEDPILPDTIYCISFEYRYIRVVLRISNSGLTIHRSKIDDYAISNMGLRSECTGWLFYDSTRGQSGDIDLDRIFNDVSYRCHFVGYVISHVNAMLKEVVPC